MGASSPWCWVAAYRLMPLRGHLGRLICLVLGGCLAADAFEGHIGRLIYLVLGAEGFVGLKYFLLFILVWE